MDPNARISDIQLKAAQYRLKRWGENYPLHNKPKAPSVLDSGAPVAMSSEYWGNGRLAQWVKFKGPPPAGRDVDQYDCPLDYEVELAVKALIPENPQIAFALRAKYGGRGRASVERYELWKEWIEKPEASKRAFWSWVKIGEALIVYALFHKSLQSVTKTA